MRLSLEKQLHLAAEDGNPKQFKLLLEANPAIDLVNSDGQTVLDIAQANVGKWIGGSNYRKIVELIKDYIFDDILKTENLSRYRVTFRSILREILDKRDSNGKALLHLFSCRENTPFAIQLLEAGAAVDPKDNLGNTPLYYAVQFCRNRSFKRALIEHGANILEKNKEGDTPLHNAASYGQGFFETDFLLKDTGAIFTAQNKNGETPFDLFAKTGNVRFFKLLLGRLASGDSQIEENHIPALLDRALALAFFYKEPEIMKLALNNEFGLQAKDLSPALSQAVYNEDMNSLKDFIQRGACVNSVSVYWKEQHSSAIMSTPLSAALAKKSATMLRFLLKEGAYLLSNAPHAGVVCITEHRDRIMEVLGLMSKEQKEEMDVLFKLAPVRMDIFAAISGEDIEFLYSILNQARKDFSPNAYRMLFVLRNTQGFTPLEAVQVKIQKLAPSDEKRKNILKNFIEALDEFEQQVKRSGKEWAVPSVIEKDGLKIRESLNPELPPPSNYQALRQAEQEARQKLAQLERPKKVDHNGGNLPKPPLAQSGFFGNQKPLAPSAVNDNNIDFNPARYVPPVAIFSAPINSVPGVVSTAPSLEEVKKGPAIPPAPLAPAAELLEEDEIAEVKKSTEGSVFDSFKKFFGK